MIYFDNAASTYPLDEVLETFLSLCKKNSSNPSSPHLLANENDKIIAKSKRIIYKYLNLSENDYEIVFTSGATESNNLFIKGFIDRNPYYGDTIVTSSYEHPSVTNIFKTSEFSDKKIIFLSGNNEGTININELKNVIDNNKVSLISLMLVNNETGNILNLKEVSSLLKKENKNIIFHSDITQSVGKIDFDYSIFDAMSMSFHKIQGLKSSGLLIYKKSIKINTILNGGSQQNYLRSGTLNAPLIASSAISLKHAITTRNEREEVAKSTKDYISNYLLEHREEYHINTDLKNSSPFILNFSFLKSKASVVVEYLSKKEIYVSTTSACSSHVLSASRVLHNMGFNDVITNNSIRISFIGNETLNQAKEFISELKNIQKELKKEN